MGVLPVLGACSQMSSADLGLPLCRNMRGRVLTMREIKGFLAGGRPNRVATALSGGMGAPCGSAGGLSAGAQPGSLQGGDVALTVLPALRKLSRAGGAPHLGRARPPWASWSRQGEGVVLRGDCPQLCPGGRDALRCCPCTGWGLPGACRSRCFLRNARPPPPVALQSWAGDGEKRVLLKRPRWAAHSLPRGLAWLLASADESRVCVESCVQTRRATKGPCLWKKGC